MRKGERRKQELLQIAYRMFITFGYENTSIDEIIAEAGIAKGTYYYYFESKEQTLEEVIGMMIDKEAEMANQIIQTKMSVPEKIVAIISSIRPTGEELPIEDALNRPENVIMHNKIRKRLIDTVVPILVQVVEEGVSKGIFSCDNIPQRVRMLLVVSDDTFNEGVFSTKDIDVFIDLTEKLLGAKQGTMSFIRELIK